MVPRHLTVQTFFHQIKLDLNPFPGFQEDEVVDDDEEEEEDDDDVEEEEEDDEEVTVL